MRRYGLILLFIMQCFLIPRLSYAVEEGGGHGSYFNEWWLEFIHHAEKAKTVGETRSQAEWGGIRTMCMSQKGSPDSPYERNLSFFATRAKSAEVLQKSIERITIEDQMNVAMFLAQPKGLAQNIVDYKSRGELLVRHPLAMPVNLMAWCVAQKAQEMIPRFCVYAVKLFGMLLLIEFVWMAANFVMKFATLGQIIDGMITKMHLWTFLGSIIITGFYGFSNSNWMYSVFNSFNHIGNDVITVIYADMQKHNTDPNGNEITPQTLSSKGVVVGNTSTNTDPVAGEILSPGSYFAMGVLIISSLWSKVSFGFDIYSLLLIPVLIFVTPIVLTTFSKMVADIALTMLEGYLAAGLLLIMIAFGGARWGSDYIQKVILYCVMMGFKLLTFYVLFAIGVRMMAYVAISTHYIQSLGDFIVAVMSMLAITMLLSFLFHRLPQAAGALFGGSPTMSFGQFMGDTLNNIEAGSKAVSGAASVAGKGIKFVGDKTGATKGLAKLKAATGAKMGDMVSKTGAGTAMKDSGKKAQGALEKAKIGKGGGKGSEGSGKDKSGDDKKGSGSKDAKKATKGGFAGVKEAFSGVWEDTPSTGNFITPTVTPPPDE